MENKIPGRLKQLRNRKKLILQQLAQKTDCTKSYISQFEKGTSSPSIAMLGRLAEALEIPVADLIRDEGGQTMETGNCEKLIEEPFITPMERLPASF